MLCRPTRTASTAATPSWSTNVLAAALIGSRFLHYAALLILFGASLFPAYSFGEGGEPARASAWRGTLLKWAAAITLLAGLGWLAFTAAQMSGDIQDAANADTVWLVATNTEFGHLWLSRIALAALAVALSWARPRSIWLMTVVSAALLASLSLTGHARAGENLLHMAADAIHLLAAGAWVGALVPLGWMLWRSPAEAATADALRRFSMVGYIAVGALVLTGVVNGLAMLDTPGRLLSTNYGRLLLVKVALFAVMLAFAAANRLYLTPRLALGRAETSLRRLKGHVFAEQGLAALVVLTVSILGTLDPAT